MEPDLRDVPATPACPLLGVVGDSRTRFTFPHPGHRCHATRRPIEIELDRQSSDCLSAEFVTCDRFQALVPRSEALARIAASRGAGGATPEVSERSADRPADRPESRPAPAARRRRTPGLAARADGADPPAPVRTPLTGADDRASGSS